jgi:hypothetical protein
MIQKSIFIRGSLTLSVVGANWSKKPERYGAIGW